MFRLTSNNLKVQPAKPWTPVFEGEGEGEGEGTSEGSGETATFTQEDVNRLVAEEKRKGQVSGKRALTELEALRKKSKLTNKERQELDTRVEELQSQLMTTEELSKRDKNKLAKAHTTALESATTELTRWKDRYTGETIHRSIADAAASQGAFSTRQIVALLRPDTRLVEVLDDNGEATGSFATKVKFVSKGKDGSSVTLDLTPSEAVKRMKEEEEYFNLFKGDGTSGSGLRTRSSGSTAGVDILALTKDHASYVAARKAGKIKL